MPTSRTTSFPVYPVYPLSRTTPLPALTSSSTQVPAHFHIPSFPAHLTSCISPLLIPLQSPLTSQTTQSLLTSCIHSLAVPSQFLVHFLQLPLFLHSPLDSGTHPLASCTLPSSLPVSHDSCPYPTHPRFCTLSFPALLHFLCPTSCATRTPDPPPRCCVASSPSSGGGSLFAIHGDCEAYDTRTDRWHVVASMSTRRARVGVAAVGNRLYAVGG